jgi:hypothetical protein
MLNYGRPHENEVCDVAAARYDACGISIGGFDFSIVSRIVPGRWQAKTLSPT